MNASAAITKLKPAKSANTTEVKAREEGRGADPATTIPPRLPIPYAEIRNPNAAAPWEKRV